MALLLLLSKAFEKVYQRNQHEHINTLPQEKDVSNVKVTLLTMNQKDTKELICSENPYLNPILWMINAEVSTIEEISKRRQVNKFFMTTLMEVKGGGPIPFLWLKRHLDYELCEKILSDWNYNGTFFQIISDYITATMGKIRQKITFACKANETISKWLKLQLSIVSHYMDLTFDTILLCNIIIVIGSTFEDYRLFSSVITIMLLVSIVLPILISSLSTAISRPLIVLSPEQWIKWGRSSSTLRCLILLLFPFVPATIMISNEQAKMKRKALVDKHISEDAMIPISDLEEYQLLTAFINESRLALLSFKRMELGIELVIQLSVHLIMVCLSQTDYPIESSLQAIFKSSSNEREGNNTSTLTFLVLSILWSFKTSALTSVKIKTETKSYLPLIPKLVLGIRYFLVFLTRIAAIVVYFSPYIGLLDIMVHYQAETIPLDYEMYMSFNDTLFEYWNPIEEEFQSVNISKLFRSDYSKANEFPLLPSTKEYTINDLGSAFIIFWSMFMAYAVILTTIKYFFNNDFKKASIGDKFQHIIEALNIPEAFGDWDNDNDLDVNGHLQKWKKTLIEMIFMAFIQMISNLIFLIPFFITGTYTLIQ